MNCVKCGRETKNPKFCSKYCSNSYNNSLSPKRIKKVKEKTTRIRKNKSCCRCGTPFVKEEFYTGSNEYYCKNCFKSYTNNRRKIEKQKCVDYLGGKCVVCGYDRNIKALQFHHLNPKDKEFGISEKSNLLFAKAKEELDKCILVCSNCHFEIHDGTIDLEKMGL